MQPDIVLPSHDDGVVRELAHGIGGPVGRHARVGGNRFWTPLRVVILLTLLTAAGGYLLKAPCRTHAWTDGYQYTRMCYSDVFALFFSERLHEGAVPYVDHNVEYPVVIGGAMYAVAQFVDTAVGFLDLTSVLLLVAAVVVTVATLKTAGRRRPWDAALVALAPGLVLHFNTNWDLLAVAFASLGMWAWARNQPVVAGVWWGVGTATKLYPALFFVPLLVLCLRSRRLREWLLAAVAGTLSWVLLNVFIATQHFDNWMEFFRLNRDRGADWDSLHFAIQKIMQKRFDSTFTWQPETLNMVVAVSFLVALGVISLLIYAAPRRPRVAQVFFLVLAAFLLTNKVNSPQYTLWLIPLAALARPRWGMFLAWQWSELLVLFTRYYMFVHLDDATRGVSDTWFVAAVLIRDALLFTLMLLVVREMWHPEEDVVRADGTDDPAGGPLDGALDAADARFARDPVPALP